MTRNSLLILKENLGFFRLVLLQFDNTNYVMLNLIQTFRQSSIVFEKPSILSENPKTLASSNCHRFEYLLVRIKKNLVSTHLFLFHFFKNNFRPKQTLLQTLLSRKPVQNFSQK